MDDYLVVQASRFAVVVGWLLVPVLPAWLVYRIAPDSRLALHGPIAGLTIRSAGASAAYILLLILSWSQVSSINADFGRVLDAQMSANEKIRSTAMAAVWRIEGEISLYEDTKPLAGDRALDLIRRIEVTPEFRRYRVNGNKFSISVPLEEQRVPLITIQIPHFGGKTITQEDIESLANVDQATRSIVFPEALAIRKLTPQTVGTVPPQ